LLIAFPHELYTSCAEEVNQIVLLRVTDNSLRRLADLTIKSLEVVSFSFLLLSSFRLQRTKGMKYYELTLLLELKVSVHFVQ
jgi:hypothetical protein